MKHLSILFVVTISLALAACSTVRAPASDRQANEPTQLEVPETQAPSTQASEAQPTGEAPLQLPELSDNQGAVTVIVKPLGLDSSSDSLNFEIALETHSVDLGMDLAKLATLATDSGQSVQASLWDAPRGGHHVSGLLSFPASLDGKSILDGAARLTLTIKDVDAPARVFAWDLK